MQFEYKNVNKTSIKFQSNNLGLIELSYFQIGLENWGTIMPHFQDYFVKCGNSLLITDHTTIVTYEKIKHIATIYSKWTIFSSSVSDKCTLVFAVHGLKASYDKPHQFHEKLAEVWNYQHTLLTKYDWYSHMRSCQQVPLNLSWQVLFFTHGVGFPPVL